MNRIMFLLCLLLLCGSTAVAENYFTAGINDTLRIKPSLIGSQKPVVVRAHLDGRADIWMITASYPPDTVVEVLSVSKM